MMSNETIGKYLIEIMKAGWQEGIKFDAISYYRGVYDSMPSYKPLLYEDGLVYSVKMDEKYNSCLQQTSDELERMILEKG